MAATSMRIPLTASPQRVYIFARPTPAVLEGRFDMTNIPITLNGLSNQCPDIDWSLLQNKSKEVRWQPDTQPVSRRQNKMKKNLSGRYEGNKIRYIHKK